MKGRSGCQLLLQSCGSHDAFLEITSTNRHPEMMSDCWIIQSAASPCFNPFTSSSFASSISALFCTWLHQNYNFWICCHRKHVNSLMVPPQLGVALVNRPVYEQEWLLVPLVETSAGPMSRTVLRLQQRPWCDCGGSCQSCVSPEADGWFLGCGSAGGQRCCQFHVHRMSAAVPFRTLSNKLRLCSILVCTCVL